MRIALDAMGGDHAPAVPVEGAVLAGRELGVEVLLVGDQAAVEVELGKHDTAGLPLRVIHAAQRMEMDEPASAVRRKRDSSIWVATELVKQGQAEAVVSAGHTGAAMASAFLVLGALRGIERPAIAALLPTLRGAAIMLDVGACVDCGPRQLVQFAIMGSEYAKRVLGKPSPRVGLLSIGEEDTKGNDVTREAFRLLQAGPIHFIGNLEGRDVYSGAADVIVCDGFIGNVALKISEGLADAMTRLLKREVAATALGRLGFLLLRPAFARFRTRIDYAEYGGAPLLGVNGICIICHGRSSARAIKNAMRVARQLAEQQINEHIQRDIEDSLA